MVRAENLVMIEEEVSEKGRVCKFDPGEPYLSRLVVHIAGAISRIESDELFAIFPMPPAEGVKPRAVVVHHALAEAYPKRYVVHTATVAPDGRVTFLSGDYTESLDEAIVWANHRAGYIASM